MASIFTTIGRLHDMIKRLLSGTKAQSIVGAGISALLGMLVFASLTRLLSQEVFGLWVLFTVVYTFLDMARSGLVQTYFTKAWNDGTEDRNDLITGIWGIILIFNSAITGLLVAFYFLFDHMPEHDWAWAWVGVLWVSSPMTVAQIRYQGEEDFIGFGRSRVIQQAVMLVVIWMIRPEDWWTVVFIYGGGLSFMSALEITLGKVGFIHPVRRPGIHKRIWRYGRYTSGTLLIANLLRSSDTYLLMLFLGATAVSVYAVPERLLGLIYIPVTAIIGAVIPKLSSAGKDSGHEGVVARAEAELGLLFWIILPIALVLFLFAPFLIQIIAGSGYEESVTLLRIFSVYLLLIPFDRMSGVLLDILGLPQVNFIKMMAMILFNILGDILVLEMGGSWNEVGWVTLGTLFVGVFFGVYQVNRVAKFNPLRQVISGWKMIITFIEGLNP